MDSLNLLKNVQTVDDVDVIIYQLNELTKHLFQSKKKNLELLGLFLSEENVEELLKDLDLNNIDINNSQLLSSFINKVIQKLTNLPKMSIIIAFLPTLSLLRNIMLEIDGHGKVVIDYTVDPKIYGGIVILKDGLVYDYSIQKVVSSYLSEEK